MEIFPIVEYSLTSNEGEADLNKLMVLCILEQTNLNESLFETNFVGGPEKGRFCLQLK